jgi:putative membrane protein
MAPPVQELEQRYWRLPLGWSCLLAVEFVIAMSAVYELIEWLVAVVFTPTWADSFLGQQGDIFDGQKDMALATAGAIISMTLTAIVRRGAPGAPLSHETFPHICHSDSI